MDCSLPGSSVHGIFQARVDIVKWQIKQFSDGLIPFIHGLGAYSASQEVEHLSWGILGNGEFCKALQVPTWLIRIVYLTLFRKIKEQGNESRVHSWPNIWNCLIGYSMFLVSWNIYRNTKVCWCNTLDKSSSILSLEVYFNNIYDEFSHNDGALVLLEVSLMCLCQIRGSHTNHGPCIRVYEP